MKNEIFTRVPSKILIYLKDNNNCNFRKMVIDMQFPNSNLYHHIKIIESMELVIIDKNIFPHCVSLTEKGEKIAELLKKVVELI